MYSKARYNTDIERLRSYSSVFSRSVFTRLIKFDDYSTINLVGKTYDKDRINGKTTYSDYLDWIYLSLVAQYRTEYVFKNALTNKIISYNKGRNITVFNEFRVGNSIADIATFNGKSCVYEIKTALDTPKRLSSQTEDYFKFFQECYLVVPKDIVDNYLPCVDDRMGLLTVNETKGKITIAKYRTAKTQYDNMDIEVLMRVLWIKEHEYIIKKYYGKLPDVGYFEMFGACKEMIRKIPVEKLSKMVVEVIKTRKSCDVLFNNEKKNLTQMCLALNFNTHQYVHLCDNLNKTIIL